MAKRDYTSRGGTEWDVVPEMQVAFSTRQHVRAAAGYRKTSEPQRMVKYFESAAQDSAIVPPNAEVAR